jgi:hypothetical protein
MTLQEILQAKKKLLKSAPDAYLKKIQKVQVQALDHVLSLFGNLSIKDGKIELTVKNLKIADQINSELSTVLDGTEFNDAVIEFASQFDQQKNLSEKYFDKSFPNFSSTTLQDQVYEKAKRDAVDLIAGSTPETQFLQGIKEIINDNVNSGSSFKDAVSLLREYAIGDGSDVDGKLLQYSKQVAYDSMATADRAFGNAVANELDSEWFFYAGGEIQTTREFCAEHEGKYYHKKEVEAWAAQEWSGKNETTSKETIFIYVGGWNCRHSLMPASVFDVPKDDIERNLSNGNYQPSEEELALVMG